LKLASAAGINAAVGRVERVAGRPVFLLRRFDREGTTRRPFLSAMSMLGAVDYQTRSYLEIADAIQRFFRLTQAQARRTAYEVAKAVSRWRQEATALGIAAAEINTVAPTFEHDDLIRAKAMTVGKV
jgi:hypothetical protein